MRRTKSLHPRAVHVVFAAVFDLVDRDGGGTVTKEELGELVRGFGNKGGRRNEDSTPPITDYRIVRSITEKQAEQAVFLPRSRTSTRHMWRYNYCKHPVRCWSEGPG